MTKLLARARQWTARNAAAHLGMTTGALRAIVTIFVITLALTFTTWYHGNTQAARLAAAQSAQVQTQRRQAQTQRKLDRTVRRLDSLVRKLRREVTANCAVDHDLAPLPITVGPSGKASLLGVEIVADFRGAWRKAGCTGRLAPPSPSLTRWARFYHLDRIGRKSR